MPTNENVEVSRPMGQPMISSRPPRWFEELFELPTTFGMMLRGMAADVYETDDHVVVKLPVPGIRPEDLEISVARDVVTIRGETKEEDAEKKEKKQYFYHELRYGKIARTLTLPALVKAEGSEAEIKNGVLVLTLPKTEEAKPKTIKVKTENG